MAGAVGSSGASFRKRLYAAIAVFVSVACSAVCARANWMLGSFGFTFATSWYAPTACEYAAVIFEYASLNFVLEPLEMAVESGAEKLLKALPKGDVAAGWKAVGSAMPCASACAS